MKFHPHCLAALLATASLLPESIQGRLQPRHLQASSSTPPSRWEDCLGMTGAECQDHILESLDGDLANHPIPDLKIKLNTQRPPAVLADTYWMFGVPTNIFGDADCDLHGGDSVFPFVWKASDGNDYNIPDVPCAGKNANECCQAVLDMMNDQNIPLTNSDGKCFSCWVHQQPLQPKLDVNGDMVYVEHEWEDDKCVAKEYTPTQVQANDASVVSTLIDVRTGIHNILTDPDGLVACGDLMTMMESVHLYGRSFPRAMSRLAGLFCGQCTSGNAAEVITLTIQQHDSLHFIRGELSGAIESDENCIIIYTDHTGDKVLKVPVVGGSRNDKPVVPDEGPDGGGGFLCPAPTQPNGLGGCMCPAVNMDGNEAYWLPSQITDTSGTGCECPSGMVEYNSNCFCLGGFKVWDATLLTCVCPHGTNADGSCICPGPFSGLDWNNVGWVPGVYGCRVDFDCTLSEYDYYSNFEDGCDRCGFRYVEVDGLCVLPCEDGFRYDKQLDECVCEFFPEHQLINNQCQCETLYAVIPEGEEECRCVEPDVLKYDEGSKEYYCGPDINDDYYRYYGPYY